MTAAPSMPPGYHLVALDSIGSTNAEAKRRVAAGAADGTFVWAREQTAGRGRHGRAWHSPRGNLYVSLILRPDCDAATAMQMGFVAAVALHTAIVQVAPTIDGLSLKWPNDVLLGGRKLAGILLESAARADGALDWLVVGIGVNLAQRPSDGDAATSLAEAGHGVSIEALLTALAATLGAWRARWVRQGFAPVRQSWLAAAGGLGEPIEVHLAGRRLAGVFADLDPAGALVLDRPDGRQAITAGEVFPAEAV